MRAGFLLSFPTNWRAPSAPAPQPPVPEDGSWLLSEDGSGLLQEDGYALNWEDNLTVSLLAEDGVLVLQESGAAIYVEG